MTSSLKRRSLSKPAKGEKIHQYDLETARARNKNLAHSFILELFAESNLTKSELAKMLDKKPEQITRWLAGPGNITFDTLSDLVFALSGRYVSVQCSGKKESPAVQVERFVRVPIGKSTDELGWHMISLPHSPLKSYEVSGDVRTSTKRVMSLPAEKGSYYGSVGSKTNFESAAS